MTRLRKHELDRTVLEQKTIRLSTDLPVNRKSVPQNQFGEDVGAFGERPGAQPEMMLTEHGVVGGVLGRGPGPIHNRRQVWPPSSCGIDEPLAGIPHRVMLAGTDLVIDSEGVQVEFGAQVEHPHRTPHGHLDQEMSGMIRWHHQAAASVPLTERPHQVGPGVPGTVFTGVRVESVASLRKPLPIPGFRILTLDPPERQTRFDRPAA